MDQRTPTTEERAYYDMIDRCAVESINKKISNARPDHARYLIDKLFSLSKDSVRVYTGELCAEMYDEKTEQEVQVYGHPGVVEAATDATNRGVAITIALEHQVDLSKHPLLASVRKRGTAANLRFGWIGKDGLELLQRHEVNRHMLVMDNAAYRLEGDGHPTVAADANFGDPEFASVLAQVFDIATADTEFSAP